MAHPTPTKEVCQQWLVNLSYPVLHIRTTPSVFDKNVKKPTINFVKLVEESYEYVHDICQSTTYMLVSIVWKIINIPHGSGAVGIYA